MTYFDSDEEFSEPEDPDEVYQRLTDLLAALLKEFCEEHQISPAEVPQVGHNRFLDWLAQINNELEPESIERFTKLGATETDVYHLRNIANNESMRRQVGTVWPQIVLACSPAPQHELSSLHVIALLRWKDGTAVPLSSYVPAEMASSGEYVNSEEVYTLIQTCSNILGQMATEGLDSLHDSKGVLADELAYEMLMGMLLRILNGAEVSDPDTGERVKLDEAYRERCTNVMRTLQGLFQPAIPAEVREHINRLRQQREAGSGPPTQGGWG